MLLVVSLTALFRTLWADRSFTECALQLSGCVLYRVGVIGPHRWQSSCHQFYCSSKYPCTCTMSPPQCPFPGCSEGSKSTCSIPPQVLSFFPALIWMWTWLNNPPLLPQESLYVRSNPGFVIGDMPNSPRRYSVFLREVDVVHCVFCKTVKILLVRVPECSPSLPPWCRGTISSLQGTQLVTF